MCAGLRSTRPALFWPGATGVQDTRTNLCIRAGQPVVLTARATRCAEAEGRAAPDVITERRLSHRFGAATRLRAPKRGSHHRQSPSTRGPRGSSRPRSRSPLRRMPAARTTGTGPRWWPTMRTGRSRSSRFGVHDITGEMKRIRSQRRGVIPTGTAAGDQRLADVDRDRDADHCEHIPLRGQRSPPESRPIASIVTNRPPATRIVASVSADRFSARRCP